MVDGVFRRVSAAGLNIKIPDMRQGTELENLGTTVEVIAKGGTMSLGNSTYTLKQFHFHLPSEHLDNGTSMASKFAFLEASPNRYNLTATRYSGNAYGLARSCQQNRGDWRVYPA
jgi:carbonic anhydrase